MKNNFRRKKKVSVDIKCLIRAGFFSLFAVLLSLQVYAQQGVRVSGSVTDVAGKIFPAVDVTTRGTTQYITTCEKGVDNATVSSEAIVLIFNVGYETREIQDGMHRSIDVASKEVSESLVDVMVVAFATLKKENFYSQPFNLER
ncbi:MAG: hypothetical protein LBT50_02605 [Prevotellaceae bacterium]|nr:hypothetical protein [Prevotellaceae bacterium]